VATAAGTDYKRLRLLGKEREIVRAATVAWVLKLIWDRLDPAPPLQRPPS
jgi:hypothetical protein